MAGMRFSKDEVGIALNDCALGSKKTICVVDGESQNPR